MTTSRVEALPAELKMMVLYAIPDTQSLLNLIIASPGYLEAYQTNRETTLQAVILNQVANMGINFSQPIAWMELCVGHGNAWSPGLAAAMQSYYRQSRKGKQVKLTYEQCMSLLTLIDVRTWGTSPFGGYVIHAGGPIFRSRQVVSSEPCYNDKDHEYRFLAMDREVPSYLMRSGGTAHAW